MHEFALHLLVQAWDALGGKAEHALRVLDDDTRTLVLRQFLESYHV